MPCAATRGLLLVAGSGLAAQTSHDHTTVSRKEDPQKVVVVVVVGLFKK